jgi:thiamine pyrophosphate-dependent acetolactate synthase large subunit-like protein
VGDIALIIEELAPRLRERERADWDVALLDRIKRGLAAERPRAAGSHRPDATRRARGNALLAPARAVQIARELTPAGTSAIADAGARAMVAASWAAVAPNEFVCSDDPGRGGFGLPAAIAAQLVHPGRRAVCFKAAAPLLDASAELATACRLGLPIIVVVLDDDSGDAREGDAPATMSTDVVGLAASSGVVALAAAGEEAFRQAFHRAYTSHGPCLLDARSG